MINNRLNDTKMKITLTSYFITTSDGVLLSLTFGECAVFLIYNYLKIPSDLEW